jgi:ribose transport system substrate-binding protein
LNKWYLLLVSLMAALILFMALSFMYRFSGEEEPLATEPIQIILKSNIGPAMDFWNVVNQGIQDASREFGVDVEISGPRYEKEISRQVNILESLILKKPPLIILAANDYSELAGPVEEAVMNGIPVITVDSGVDSDMPVSFIATDNIEAGRKAGREIKRLAA